MYKNVNLKDGRQVLFFEQENDVILLQLLDSNKNKINEITLDNTVTEIKDVEAQGNNIFSDILVSLDIIKTKDEIEDKQKNA